MNGLTFIGVILGILAIVGGQMLEGGSVSSILQPTAAIIVFGGTLGATLLNYPVAMVVHSLRLAFRLFFDSRLPEGSNLVQMITDLAYTIRQRGILSIQGEVEGIRDPFLKKGFQLVIDGSSPDVVRDVLEIELMQDEERDMHASRVFDSAGAYAPTIGILGAVLGLIHVMENLADPSNLGSGIAVAFVATVYGVGSANLLWLPMAGKMKVKARDTATYREIIVEGLSALSRGDHPSMIRESLEGYLPIRERRGAGYISDQPDKEEVQPSGSAIT